MKIIFEIDVLQVTQKMKNHTRLMAVTTYSISLKEIAPNKIPSSEQLPSES